MHGVLFTMHGVIYLFNVFIDLFVNNFIDLFVYSFIYVGQSSLYHKMLFDFQYFELHCNLVFFINVYLFFLDTEK